MSRASGAQARAAQQARNPPPVPVDNEEPQEEEVPMVGDDPASNNDKFRSTNEFTEMLQRIGVSRRCMDQLLSDDFDSMEVVVNQ